MTTWITLLAALWLTGAALTYRWMARELDKCEVTSGAPSTDTEVKQ